ncbi:MAG: hypothetical protein Q9214_007493, partial [Letrouitia sp. 1 TL-2023]
MLALFAAQPYKEPGAPPGNQEDDAEKGRGGHGIDMRAHLTNTCLQDGTREGSVVRFWNLESPSLSKPALESIYDQICGTTADLFKAASAQPTNFQPLPNAFEVFGVDWLIDRHKKAWLLEVNAFPDFKQSGEEGHTVVEGLWKFVIELVLRGESDGKSKGFFKDLSLTAEDEGERRCKDQDRGKGPWELKKRSEETVNLFPCITLSSISSVSVRSEINNLNFGNDVLKARLEAKMRWITLDVIIAVLGALELDNET